MVREDSYDRKMLPSACPCSVCGEGGHTVGKCPALRSPLREGFYSGGGDGGGHSHDDDERAKNDMGGCHGWYMGYDERRVRNMFRTHVRQHVPGCPRVQTSVSCPVLI